MKLLNFQVEKSLMVTLIGSKNKKWLTFSLFLPQIRNQCQSMEFGLHTSGCLKVNYYYYFIIPIYLSMAREFKVLRRFYLRIKKKEKT